MLLHSYQYGDKEFGNGTGVNKFTFSRRQIIALLWDNIHGFHGRANKGAVKSVPEHLLPDEITLTIDENGTVPGDYEDGT